ncbi:MAG: hypothetical protein JO214_00560, partial [Frankiaceae bacterium]|nr:hypothetical protein [Frankiaceae bacterium]
DPLPDLPPLSPEDFLEYCDGFARALYEDASANWAELMNAHTYSRLP